MSPCWGWLKGVTAIGRFGPERLLICLDRRQVLGERELEPHEAVHVGVGEMMDHLSWSPAALSVGRPKLPIVEPAQRRGEALFVLKIRTVVRAGYPHPVVELCPHRR